VLFILLALCRETLLTCTSYFDHKFWGSSIVSSLLDARKTAEQNNGTAVVANVTGLTLGTLIRNTMAPFRLDATEEDSRGGNLIIKMDVEGAEYQVLREINKSGILCDYIAKGNEVVMLVEFHGKEVILDDTEFNKLHVGTKGRVKILKECGVRFENLDPKWS
jgi:hypothetical protein